ERLLQRPRLVDVDLQRNVRHGAHRTDALYVQPVVAAELQLQPPEAAGDALGAAGHVVRVPETDRPGGRRPRAPEAEEGPDRQARQLPAQVVERRVDRRASCELPGREAREALVASEWIVAM